MNLKLSYPVDPLHINQPFGANPAYYASFLDSFGKPQKGHMGVDFQATHGQPVYAVADGFAFYVGPDVNGGDGIYLRVQDGTTYYTCIYWHLCAKGDPQFSPLVGLPGRNVTKGELIGYADNTGAPNESSGDHLHFGLAPCDVNGTFLEPANGYGGCIDPILYFDGTFATDTTTPPQAQGIANLAATKVDSDTKTANMLYSIYQVIRAWLK